ncbi:11s globulin subunit beta [Phtheirospermum japonicum]|uniref:11s globulin subunit beta n=1 Tax=Phtheirospermum japonicum TaxID=374723 RepID=A0A830BE15_9LAMI|nr:11s globulin subunit beta [Phtheirospermum japonicum]
MQSQQQHRLRAKTSCSLQQLNAREPSRRFDYEAGSSEHWDPNCEEFECAGVEFVRHTIQPKGLLLPYYTNAPQLIYIIQGSGIHGNVIPGCAETYESGSSSSYSASSEGEQGEGRRSSGDRHQKLRRFKQGDILALQPGITHWAYNDGDTPIITVSFRDVANEANQLDLKFRKFFLAGNPQATQSQGRERREQEYRRGEEQEQEQDMGNIFRGFDQEFLAQALNIDREIVRKMQAREDNRGDIVRAERLSFVLPEEQEQQQRREGGGYNHNGLEETFCSINIRQNIDNPSKADVYNPRAGRVTRLISQKLPILNYLRLSADRGVLYKNAMMAPHWSVNSHTITYVIRGSARIQVVGNQGNTVFDDEVREGQLLVVPQNFATVKRANEQGFEWVAFRTNDNAMIGQLAGRLSAIRAMPEEVLMNAYGVSRKDARSLKYNREETTLLSPVSKSGGHA